MSTPPTHLSWQEYLDLRNANRPEYLFIPGPAGSTRTILITSHIWWTEQIALAIRNAGHHILVHHPFYALYTEERAFVQFDAVWNALAARIRHHHVSLILGGNSSALLPHPATGQLLHEVAADRPIPLVNWWWDEPRTRPPFATKHGHALFSPADYLRFLNNAHALNAVWDLDVLEELRHEFALSNLLHLPLATLPEFWPPHGPPLEKRPLAACFLGNCHFTADWVDQPQPDPLLAWAIHVAQAKYAHQDTSMIQCAQQVGTRPQASATFTAGSDPWADFAKPWELVNAAWMHLTRHKPLLAAARALKGKLALIGTGWDQLGLHANQDHAQDKSGLIYASAKCALNLFGGCVHSGMPLRPFDITASSGLLLTHHQRELPALFSPDECLSFRTPDELLLHFDRILAAPQEFNALVAAGRRKTLTTHTWTHRIQSLLAEVDTRFPSVT